MAHILEAPLSPIACQDEAAASLPPALENDEREAQVRWLMSGDLAAVVCVRPNMSLVDLKADLQNLTGVPASEQRLFVDDEELLGTALPPNFAWSVLSILRVSIDPCKTNLGHFRVPLSFEALPRGEFTEVKKLAKGINGHIVACKWSRDQVEETVAVKKILNSTCERALRCTEVCEKSIHFNRRSNAPDPEDALTEIGILTYLSQQQDLPVYLLKTKAVFAESPCTWLVTEYADGGELFEIAASPQAPDEAQVKSLMWQVLQAIDYLHHHHIGHRDISLENVLLKDGVVRLMDFGMAVQSHTESGIPLRYFRAVGKDFYRAPECYVPPGAEVKVTPRPGDVAGDVAMLRVGSNYLCEVRLPHGAEVGRQCSAEVWGYAAQPADVFSAGICLFILGFQNPAWSSACLSDPAFSFVYKQPDTNGLERLLRMWNKRELSSEAMQVLGSMLQFEPSKRPTAAECLSKPWFAEFDGAAVPTHVVEI